MLSDAIKTNRGNCAKSHVVVETAMLSEEELLEFMACVEDNFEPGCGRVIHFLTSTDTSAHKLLCREKITDCPDYTIEEMPDPNLLRAKMFPYYYFNGNMEFWEKLFEAADCVRGVCYAFLSDFLWKTHNNVVWPYHLKKKELSHARERMVNILNQVPDEFILSYKGIDNFYRSYLFGMKSEGSTGVRVLPETLQIVRNGNVVYEAKKLEIVLTKFRPEEDKIAFVAFIKSPVFNFCKEPVLWMESNGDTGDRQKIPLKKSSWRFYKSKEETNSFYTFVLDIDTKKIKEFHFYVEVEGTVYDTYYYFMPEVVFNTKLDRYRYYKGRTEYRFDHNTFLINTVDEGVEERYCEHIQKQFEETEPEICEYRGRIREKRKEKRKIWLYYDCKGVYKDNGYLQFRHDFGIDDGIERYYILNNDLESCRELFTKEQIPFVVQFGSDEHKMLYCLAGKVITAYIEKNNYLPFTDAEYAKLIDVAEMPMIIYLQHGVYHAYIPWKYSLDRLQIDKKVISVKFEHEQDIYEHCFTEQYEIASCMPRYDSLDQLAEPQKKILFAPSWRKYLVDMAGHEWITREDVFLESKFYKETMSFLKDEVLNRTLKQYGYRLEFKLHPILMRYAHLYSIDGETIVMAAPSVKEEDYAIFITDFSSYVFDFAYLKRSILYFVPDYEEFQSGMNDYRECVLPFDDALGEFTDKAKDAVRILNKMVRRGGKPSLKYAKRMNKLFYYKDNSACQRIYEKLV